MRIKVAGTGLTKFGELWDKSLSDLAFEASLEAINDSRLVSNDIDAVYVANMLSGQTSSQDHLGAVIASSLNIKGAAFRIEGACASGGLALHLAIQSILAGTYKNVLVIGAEKMTDVPQSDISAALMGAGSEEERKAGLTFPALYALMAKAHMAKFGTTRNQLASVSVKNHYHASFNEKAQFPFEISMDKVLTSPMICSPLSLFDASPVTDGASAVVLSSQTRSSASSAYNPPRRWALTPSRCTSQDVFITGSAVATDTIDLAQRSSLVEIAATKKACQKALKQAGVDLKDIKIAEVHDCFTIAEILAMEDLGFCNKGEGGEFIQKGTTRLGGKLPVNTSGGLKACGHPVGATGIKQIIEITHQLQKRAGKRQVNEVNLGLTHNVGGSGATAVVHILQN
ncbi:thiolase domain-containing protein [Candidatus Daviesbacteria bacterium]|nr:thiolase domain-containing protein [Candidatus Daviesbacteria bacterium]